MYEPQYRRGTKRLRPFANSARVRARGCSKKLQRLITDFGATVPFAKVVDKMVEHHGILVAESTAQRVTEYHAKCIHTNSGGMPQGLPAKLTGKHTLIAEIDGSMVPIVSPSEVPGEDHRKGKILSWKEARLSLAHVQGCKDIAYAASMFSNVDEAGRQLRACAKRAGFDSNQNVHVVADGASWIPIQVKKRFGMQGNFLLDFYHVCEYLAGAAKAIEDQPTAYTHWMEQQRQRLKTGDIAGVLRVLQEHLEQAQVADDDAPVRTCFRYLNTRADQLDYPTSIANDLPIGSGEIESGHRYVIQARMKRPGSWWLAANASNMISLGVNRANGEWNAYWNQDWARYA